MAGEAGENRLRPRLLWSSSPAGDPVEHVAEADRVTIGRKTDGGPQPDLALDIPEGFVSPGHCEIAWNAEHKRWVVRVPRANGTFVRAPDLPGCRPMEVSREVAIVDGSVIGCAGPDREVNPPAASSSSG